MATSRGLYSKWLARDVYLIEDSFVLKLCPPGNERRSESNRLEAAALQATQNLRQTPSLLFTGECVVEVFEARYGGIQSITLAVSALLASYEGPSLDHLMRTHFALPYNQTTAFFLLAAYQELALMVFEGVSHKQRWYIWLIQRSMRLVTKCQLSFWTLQQLGKESYAGLISIRYLRRRLTTLCRNALMLRIKAGISLVV